MKVLKVLDKQYNMVLLEEDLTMFGIKPLSVTPKGLYWYDHSSLKGLLRGSQVYINEQIVYKNNVPLIEDNKIDNNNINVNDTIKDDNININN